VDDSSGWDAVLVVGWGPLVREVVCVRVEDALAAARGVLAIAATDPDHAPAATVERLHDAIVEAIAIETGANLDQLGSQSAWATYDDVWSELGRRSCDDSSMELVPGAVIDHVTSLLQQLPRTAVEQAGAVLDGLDVRLVRAGSDARLDLEGLHRWLATDQTAGSDLRTRARQVVAVVRGSR
jgi:hypothetical protein